MSCYFIYRLLSSVSFASVYMINYEIFPTQIRAVGSTFVYIFGEAAGIIQPLIISALQRNEINVLDHFILIALLGLIPIYFTR